MGNLLLFLAKAYPNQCFQTRYIERLWPFSLPDRSSGRTHPIFRSGFRSRHRQSLSEAEWTAGCCCLTVCSSRNRQNQTISSLQVQKKPLDLNSDGLSAQDHGFGPCRCFASAIPVFRNKDCYKYHSSNSSEYSRHRHWWSASALQTRSCGNCFDTGWHPKYLFRCGLAEKGYGWCCARLSGSD